MSAFVGVSVVPTRGQGLSRCRRVAVTASAKPLKVNTDMKGKPVWTLREANSSDAGGIAALEDLPLDSQLIASMIQHSEGSALVAQVTLKGGSDTSAAALARPDDKAEQGSSSESSSNMIVGAVLPSVTGFVADPNDQSDPPTVKKQADIVALKVDSRMPEHEDVRKKLLLGSLRKLKTAKVNDTYVSTRKGAPEASIFKESGFQDSKSDDDADILYANLVSLNPDPLKKIA
mmetsp:Transcript_6438/g.19506  ORF Transcript_6438/g.19506 Transcript_6438/m.19506 type:complete len:232 (+) Transcript_6438:138-833(+)